ncbi:MAG: hypothetical protein AAF541_19265 [Pseudomonadota bacterium]
MKLVESYVQEVSQFLPQTIREEVAQDLRTSIAEEVYELADANDREPAREDQVEVLRRFGHPLKVASQYQQPRYVIGPDLYPIYLHALKIACIAGLAFQVVVFLISGHLRDWQVGVFDTLRTSVEILFWMFAIVTSIFVVLEYSGEKLRLYDKWAPEKLSGENIGVINRQDVITNFIGEGVFLLWWNDVLAWSTWFPMLQEHIHLAPVWHDYFWHLNIIFGAAFVLHAWVLFRGVWQHSELVSEIVLNVALLAVGGVLLGAQELAILPKDELVAVSDHLQTVLRTVLVVIIGFTAWDIWLAFKTLRSKLSFSDQEEGAAV